MTKVALFYHVYMGGGSIPANGENSFRIVTEQMSAMYASALMLRADKVVVGVAGSEADFMAMSMMFTGHAEVVHVHGVGELPTMKLMQDFCKDNPDWLICYLHTKGAIHNGSEVFENWRKCMERVVIWGWANCLAALQQGFDTAGAHWLTPSMYSFIGPVPYWGGNFFWATAKHLNTLPPIDVNADRYQAEVWIGKSPYKPKARDYARHFPMTPHCHP